MTGATRVACFAMGEDGHFRRLCTIAAELVRAGAEVCVWSDARFAERVEAVGARFADLFAGRALADVDDASRPIPVRFVTFAGACGEAVAREVGAWRPDVIVHDGFALIGRVVAESLGLPWVTAQSGHAVDAPAFRAALIDDPRVAIDPRCTAAVERLRARHGLEDASPFSYVADASPWLNLYGEPAEWLDAAERARFEPLECFGALPSSALTDPPAAPDRDGVRRVYVAFGTVVWRYFADQALSVIEAVAAAVERLPGARVSASLSRADIDGARRAALVARGVVVEDWVDQWARLGASDVFVTHHGLGSTHEAVARGVPMLSWPFFWDQPALAARCQALGVARPLPRDLDPDAIAQAVVKIIDDHAEVARRLAELRGWERAAHAQRPVIARRVLALASTSH